VIEFVVMFLPAQKNKKTIIWQKINKQIRQKNNKNNRWGQVGKVEKFVCF
jgi:hypothetical protein